MNPTDEVIADPVTDVVPFGKYKGRPVADLIADRSYVEWLQAQPWLADRQRPIYNLIIGASGPEPQDSPEHNALQARYLDHDQCMRVGIRYVASTEELRDTRDAIVQEHLSSALRGNLISAKTGTHQVSRLRFEEGGWDVVFDAHSTLPGDTEFQNTRTCECPLSDRKYPADVRREQDHIDGCPYLWPRNDQGRYEYAQALRSSEDVCRVGIELKPTIGEEYPSVLRAVLNRIRRDQASGRRIGGYAVVTDRITATSVSADKISKMFDSQGVALLLSEELRPFACQCDDC